MGFLSGLGEAIGELMARAQARMEAFELYRQDYENMSPQQLLAEYRKLKADNESFFHSKETELRLMTVKMLLERMKENGEI